MTPITSAVPEARPRGRPKNIPVKPMDVFHPRNIAIGSLSNASSVNKVVHTQAHFMSSKGFKEVPYVDINMDMPKSYAYQILLTFLDLEPIKNPVEPVQPVPHPNGPILRPFTRDSVYISFFRRVDQAQMVDFLVLPGEPPEGEPWFVLGKDAIEQCLGADWTPEKMRQQQQQQLPFHQQQQLQADQPPSDFHQQLQRQQEQQRKQTLSA